MRHQCIREKRAFSHLLLELETFPLVLILQVDLLRLEGLQRLDALLLLDGQVLDVSGALADEPLQAAMNQVQHRGCARGSDLLLLLWLVVLRDVGDGRAREARSDGRMGEGRVLGRRRGEVDLAEGDVVRHGGQNDGQRGQRIEERERGRLPG